MMNVIQCVDLLQDGYESKMTSNQQELSRTRPPTANLKNINDIMGSLQTIKGPKNEFEQFLLPDLTCHLPLPNYSVAKLYE